MGKLTYLLNVSLDGFDTHSDQAGAHASLLDQVGGALAAFGEDLAGHGQLDRVMTLVFSEFGRRLQENASRGTDHGAAAPVFLVGSKVKLDRVGGPFNGSGWYVTHVHHSYDRNDGFRTRFEAERATVNEGTA